MLLKRKRNVRVNLSLRVVWIYAFSTHQQMANKTYMYHFHELDCTLMLMHRKKKHGTIRNSVDRFLCTILLVLLRIHTTLYQININQLICLSISQSDDSEERQTEYVSRIDQFHMTLITM
jgi:NurA-like 5'-3' nuclease